MKRTILLFAITAFFAAHAKGQLPSNIRFEKDTLNRIEIVSGSKRIAVNRALEPHPDSLLLTHVRRDTLGAARLSGAAQTVAPERSVPFLEAENLWLTWWDERFNYYEQQVRQWPLSSYEADTLLPPSGKEFELHSIPFKAVDTPGYTRDGMSFLATLEGRKVAFVGDLLLAGGKVRDLYSFQDAIPEAKIGGYHGYLGRLGVWIRSLERLAAEKPDLLVPSRGPVSETPLEDIRAAIESARKIYRNYLSTNALHWYFGEERMGTCAELVLGPDHGFRPPELCEHIDLPDWCHHIGTTKLLVSDSGSTFALDVGSRRSLESLIEFEEQGLIRKLDGIFATHAHNDHTAAIAEAAAHFDCPVYALPEVASVLTRPGDWFLPGVSPNKVSGVTMVEDTEAMQWEEFTFTFRFFPGQMHNHGALLVERPDQDPVFFIGDSFSPSGIDDYCMMNRNLMREDTGYLACFQILDELPASTWLVNQHIPHLFRFTEAEREHLETLYLQRREMISAFSPGEDPNFAIDEQWARFFPYAHDAISAGSVKVSLVVENHATSEQDFSIRIRRGDAILAKRTLPVSARESKTVEFDLELKPDGEDRTILTADVERSSGFVREGHCEVLIRWKK